MTRFAGILAIAGSLVALSGCAGEGLNPERAAQHKAMLAEVHARSAELGLPPGDISKQCVVFECNSTDNYQSTTYITGADLTDEIVCERFSALAEAIDYTASRRDGHDEDQFGTKLPDLTSACIETIGVNNGTGTISQSEALVIYAVFEATDRPIGLVVQLQSVQEPDGAPEGERGYFLGMTTSDEVIYSVGN